MWSRAALVLAFVVALLGAPPTVSAASNALESPVVTPRSGPIGTAVVLRVTYDGRHPAASIVAAVGGTSLPMTRISGTARAGTWQVTAIALPVGTWPVTFVAVVGRGNAPVLAAGSLTVSGSGQPSATPTPTDQAGGPGPEHASPRPGTVPGGATPTSAPAPAPDPGGDAAKPGSGTGSAPDATPEPPTAAPAGTVANDDSESGKVAPAQPEPETVGPTAEPAPASGDPASDADPSPLEALASPSADDDGEADVWAEVGERFATDGATIAAFSGAVLTGLAGLFFVLFARRRRRQATEPAGAIPVEDTAALLQRRALRHARTVIEDDPIVSSMGIDETALAARAPKRRRRGPDRSS